MCRDMRYARGQTDRQTDRHGQHNTPLPYRGRSKCVIKNKKKNSNDTQGRI